MSVERVGTTGSSTSLAMRPTVRTAATARGPVARGKPAHTRRHSTQKPGQKGAGIFPGAPTRLGIRAIMAQHAMRPTPATRGSDHRTSTAARRAARRYPYPARTLPTSVPDTFERPARRRSCANRHLDDARAEGCRFDDHLGRPSERAITHTQAMEQLHANRSERRDVRDPLPIAPSDEHGDQPRAQCGMKISLNNPPHTQHPPTPPNTPKTHPPPQKPNPPPPHPPHHPTPHHSHPTTTRKKKKQNTNEMRR